MVHAFLRHPLPVAGRLLLLTGLCLLAACGDDTTPGNTTADALVQPDTGTPGPVCGDGVVEVPEVCDDAAQNGAHNRCGDDCLGPAPHCGDGILQAASEVCDDGDDNGDYGKCGYGCNGPAVHCGNGFIEADHEACDDGPDRNGTYGFCASDCLGPASGCGDGQIDAPQESCDDGPDNGAPGRCPVDCAPLPGCGDGAVVAPEACDDGVDNGAYGKCAGDCSGDGARCGDGVVQAVEACDDAALNGRYGHCKSDCQGLGPRCGDAVTQASDEHCDDGPDNGSPGHCDVDCLAPTSGWIAQPELLTTQASTDGATCSDDDLLSKYMRYRLRLRGDATPRFPGFVVFGEGPGESMVASRREPDESCANHWLFGACPKADDPDAKGFYSWGDATVWHADYLAVLAMEYAMFQDLGLSTDETLSDLALAMKAFDRLDERAESFYPGAAPARDGFFVRDDVPADFAVKADGSYRWPRDDDYLGYECVNGDILCGERTIMDGAFTSQDQSLSLVWGFAMIAHLLPEGLTVDGVDFVPHAKEAVHRLVWFLRKHGWKVNDPDGFEPPGVWGGDALGFSNAFAKSANVVVGDAHGVDDYRNFASRTAGELAWAGIQVIWDATHWFNRTHALRLAATNGTWGPSKMPRMALRDGKDYFAMTYALMHDVRLEAPWSDWRVEALLRSAPCSGPCVGAGCEDAAGWQGESRFFNSNNRFGGRHGGHADFNGLDYMGLFAAYHLMREGRWAPKVTKTAVVATDCSGFMDIETIASQGAANGTTYDPNAACAAGDMTRTYCRRTWGAWLHDAYRGKVTLFAGGGRWQCDPGQPCQIVHGGGGNTSGDDLILGTPGADDLKGGDGNDCIVGFDGDDLLQGGQGYDELWGMGGADRLYGESKLLPVDGEADVIFGGPGDDLLDGNIGRDELYGEAGDDTLDGGNDDDFMLGGDGNDSFHGRGGDDTMKGGDGDDRLIGDGGNDNIWGGAGRDALDGEAGDDFLNGGLGPDFLRGGNGDDTLLTGDEHGMSDHDRACGNSGDDTIWGGWDGDECLGGGWLAGGTDTINGCDDGTATSGDCDSGAFDDW